MSSPQTVSIVKTLSSIVEKGIATKSAVTKNVVLVFSSTQNLTPTNLGTLSY